MQEKLTNDTKELSEAHQALQQLCECGAAANPSSTALCARLGLQTAEANSSEFAAPSQVNSCISLKHDVTVLGTSLF